MTISSILFGVGLALLAAAFVIRPLRDGSYRAAVTQSAGERQQLLAQKAAVYAAIHEIDTDVQVGKLEPADHRVLRQRYIAEGVAILKALDALPVGDEVDQEIEADVARVASHQPLEARGGAFCSACGAAAERDDRFCSRCGVTLRN